MEPVRSIVRLGFPRWYERRLIEAHAWLVTGILCAIYVGVALEELSFNTQPLAWLGTTAGCFLGGLIAWRALRSFFVILDQAERLSRQSTCAACRAYARYDVVSPLARIGVRCRACGNEWTMS